MYLSEDKKVKRKKVSHKKILDYWDSHTSEMVLNVDFSEGLTNCWGCGCKRKLEGAHIIPHCLGGESIPENMVLLCKKCNTDNPHSKSTEDFWMWMRTKAERNKGGFYGFSRFFDILEEYNKLYSTKFVEDAEAVFIGSDLDYVSEYKNFFISYNKDYYLSNLSTFAVLHHNFISAMKNKRSSIKFRTKLYRRLNSLKAVNVDFTNKYQQHMEEKEWGIDKDTSLPDLADADSDIFKRPLLKNLLEKAKDKLFDILVVENFPILGTDKIQNEIYNTLKVYGVKLYSCDEEKFFENDNVDSPEVDMSDIDDLLKEIVEG